MAQVANTENDANFEMVENIIHQHTEAQVQRSSSTATPSSSLPGVKPMLAAGKALVMAYDTYNDVFNDSRNFMDKKARFEALERFLQVEEKAREKIEGIADKVNVIRQQCEQSQGTMVGRVRCQLTGNAQDQLCDIASQEMNSFSEIQEEYMTEYNKLKEVFGDPISLQAEADKVLRQHEMMQIVNLIVTYGQMYSGYLKLKDNTDKLGTFKAKLDDIQERYVTPVVNAYYAGEPIDKSLLDAGLDRLDFLSEFLEPYLETAKTEAYTQSINAVSQAFSFMGSVSALTSVGKYASTFVYNLHAGIAVAEGVAAVGSLSLACWAGYNWHQWSALAADIREKVKQLELISKKL